MNILRAHQDDQDEQDSEATAALLLANDLFKESMQMLIVPDAGTNTIISKDLEVCLPPRLPAPGVAGWRWVGAGCGLLAGAGALGRGAGACWWWWALGCPPHPP